jgi:hypothetical protein
MLGAYGNLRSKNICARCTRCGEYRVETQLYHGKKDEFRCLICKGQVRLKPSPSGMALTKRRWLKRKNEHE